MERVRYTNFVSEAESQELRAISIYAFVGRPGCVCGACGIRVFCTVFWFRDQHTSDPVRECSLPQVCCELQPFTNFFIHDKTGSGGVFLFAGFRASWRGLAQFGHPTVLALVAHPPAPMTGGWAKGARTTENGREWPSMAENGREWPRMAENGREWPRMAENGREWPRMVENGREWPRMAEDGLEWPRMA